MVFKIFFKDVNTIMQGIEKQLLLYQIQTGVTILRQTNKQRQKLGIFWFTFIYYI